MTDLVNTARNTRRFHHPGENATGTMIDNLTAEIGRLRQQNAELIGVLDASRSIALLIAKHCSGPRRVGRTHTVDCMASTASELAKVIDDALTRAKETDNG